MEDVPKIEVIDVSSPNVNNGRIFAKNKNLKNANFSNNNNGYLTPNFVTKGNQVDPFKHRLNLGVCGYLKIALMSVTIAPLRFLCVLFLMAFAAFVSKVGLLCASDAETKPFGGVRKVMQDFVFKISRAIFFCMGFHEVLV